PAGRGPGTTGTGPEAVDEDDAAFEEAAETDAKDAVLCGKCGALHAATAAGSGTGPCGCPAAHLRAVRRLPGRSGTPRGCASCGARGTGMIRLFESGNESSAA